MVDLICFALLPSSLQHCSLPRLYDESLTPPNTSQPCSSTTAWGKSPVVSLRAITNNMTIQPDPMYLLRFAFLVPGGSGREHDRRFASQNLSRREIHVPADDEEPHVSHGIYIHPSS